MDNEVTTDAVDVTAKAITGVGVNLSEKTVLMLKREEKKHEIARELVRLCHEADVELSAKDIPQIAELALFYVKV